MDFELRDWGFKDEKSELKPQKGLNSNRRILNGEASAFDVYYYEAFQHMALCFFDICASKITGSGSDRRGKLVQFNYCVSGRIELSLEDGFNLCLNEGDFCVSKEVSKSPSFFPTKEYKGITVYFEENSFYEENKDMLNIFGLPFLELANIYFSERSTLVSKANGDLRAVMHSLWEKRENLSDFRLKHSVLEILHILLEYSSANEKNHSYYTRLQAQIAKSAEEILTKNLEKHIPIRILAVKFGVSETSLKNYFKAVFGENISLYLRKIRMKKAAQMLLETNLSVGEISGMVGYTKQGKFAELFRNHYGYSPLEYRRIKFSENKLEK